MEPAGGAREAAVGGDGHEGPQLRKLHTAR
jgi:hypothetical protein